MDQGMEGISLEPGGQFELSGAPLQTLHQTCAEVNSHLYQVCATLLLYGVHTFSVHFQCLSSLLFIFSKVPTPF